jgi:hypothetical protein
LANTGVDGISVNRTKTAQTTQADQAIWYIPPFKARETGFCCFMTTMLQKTFSHLTSYTVFLGEDLKSTLLWIFLYLICIRLMTTKKHIRSKAVGLRYQVSHTLLYDPGASYLILVFPSLYFLTCEPEAQQCLNLTELHRSCKQTHFKRKGAYQVRSYFLNYYNQLSELLLVICFHYYTYEWPFSQNHKF